MKPIVIISGKGGTERATLAASFASLAKNKVIADRDVDAPDLHLLLKPEVREKHEFIGSKVAEIGRSKCAGCGSCEEACGYDVAGIMVADVPVVKSADGAVSGAIKEIWRRANEDHDSL